MSSSSARRRRPPNLRESFAEQTRALVDPAPPMGIQLRPLANADGLRFQEEVPVILLPLDHGVIEIRDETETWLLDRASWLVLPAQRRFWAIAKSPTASLLLFALHPEVREATGQLHQAHLNPQRLEQFLTTPQLLSRTTWVHEITHRYLFERSVCGDRHGLAARFLESELVKELYFHCLDRANARERSSLVRRRDPIVERAINFLEAQLFEPISVTALAEACSTSPSTLQRVFRRELGEPPSRYLRQRRLQESVLLLKAGRYSVSEVAALVGYDNLAAFSHAFRARFGRSPSEIRRQAVAHTNHG